MANDNKKPADTRVKVKDGRLAYADQLLVPKAFEEGQQPKYSCTILLPPDHPAIELIEAAAEAAAVTRWGKKADWPKQLRGINRDPIIKACEDYPAIGKLPPGWCFVRASSTEPPGIVGPDVEEIAKQDLRREIYSGRHANLSLQSFAYQRMTGSGVSLGLGNIQLTKHDDRLGTPRPNPGEEFDPEELPETDNDGDNDDDLAPPRRPRRR